MRALQPYKQSKRSLEREAGVKELPLTPNGVFRMQRLRKISAAVATCQHLKLSNLHAEGGSKAVATLRPTSHPESSEIPLECLPTCLKRMVMIQDRPCGGQEGGGHPPTLLLNNPET